MGQNLLLVNVGLLLTLYGVVMLVIYLWREKGSMFDVITVSWAGYILYIAVAMLATGLLTTGRLGEPVAGLTVLLMVLSTVFYTLGLYAGSGRFFSIALIRKYSNPKLTASS